MTKPSNKTQDNPYIFHIERILNAPRESVWKAWTDPDQVKKWFGPKGSTITNINIDLHPGGASSYGMEFGGTTMYGRWAYKDIKAPEEIVAIVSFTDKDGNIIVHPMMPNWPREILSTVNFIDMGNKTKIAVDWSVHNGTDMERKTFKEGSAGMEQGWGGSFNQLEKFLTQNK